MDVVEHEVDDVRDAVAEMAPGTTRAPVRRPAQAAPEKRRLVACVRDDMRRAPLLLDMELFRARDCHQISTASPPVG
jgi:hypothetical protein